jgi:hypothetical protein
LHPKALVVAVCAFVLPVIAGAQSQPTSGTLPLVRGSRVRVRASVMVTPLIANYLELRKDTLVVVEEGAGRGIWTLALDQVQRLEASTGSRSMHGPYIMQGAVVGAAIGAAGGLVFASTFTPSDQSKKYSRVLTMELGGAVGALAGGFVGSRRMAEQWSRVPLPRRVSVLPDRHGVLHVAIGY